MGVRSLSTFRLQLTHWTMDQSALNIPASAQPWLPLRPSVRLALAGASPLGLLLIRLVLGRLAALLTHR